ncbi:MAG: hypothetical protein J7M39_10555, partial [Anaerolineae bacterium]|nr:hypothetical protein [Anaerolineae bacterium]
MSERFQELWGFEKVYPRSIVEAGGTSYALASDAEGHTKMRARRPRSEEGQKVLCIRGDAEGFCGGKQGDVFVAPLTAENAAALRERLSWLNPVPLGLATSAGTGDRLGSATPGHIRALRAVGGIAPILAQQSMRENARTGRTPQQVVDDACWGIFQEGWRG